MRLQRLLAVALIGVALSQQLSAQEGGRTVLAKGLFSYEAPLGWRVCLHADSNIEVAQSQSEGVIKVSIQKSDSSLQDFIKQDLKNLEEKNRAVLRSRQPFWTTAGLDGVRLVLSGPLLAGADDTPTCRVRYYFDGGSGQKIFVEGIYVESPSGSTLPLIDAAIKTFTLE
jgi:hypothetical protein